MAPKTGDWKRKITIGLSEYGKHRIIRTSQPDVDVYKKLLFDR